MEITKSMPPAPITKYPFNRMVPGDKVVLTGMEARDRHSAATAAYIMARRRGWRFTVRNIDGDLHVWRVA